MLYLIDGKAISVLGEKCLFSFLLMFWEKGAVEIASRYNLNSFVSDIITGILLFCILGSEFFINYKVSFRRKHS